MRLRLVIAGLAMMGGSAAAQISGIASVLPTGTIAGNAAIEWSSFEPGVISLWVRAGENIALIVSEHGDRVSGVTQTFDGPFDAIDVASGVDRFYRLRVRPGSEKAKVREYLADSRIQRAEIISNVVDLLAL